MNQTDPYDLPPRSPGADQLHFSPTNDERNLAIIAHLSGCIGILGAGLVGFVGPLVIYLLKKDSSPYLEVQAKEALNFQITIFLISLGTGMLLAISCGALLPLIVVPMALQLVFGIIAALAVREWGELPIPPQFSTPAVTGVDTAEQPAAHCRIAHWRIARHDRRQHQQAAQSRQQDQDEAGLGGHDCQDKTPSTAKPGGSQLAGLRSVGHANQRAASTKPIRPVADPTIFTVPVFS